MMPPTKVCGVILLALAVSFAPAHADLDLNTNGLGDIWELVYNVSNLSSNTDSDGDGLSNYKESVAGTNPFTSSNTFAIARLSVTGSTITVTWPSQLGKRYQIQSTTNLPGNAWQNEGSPWAGTGDTLSALFASSAKWFRVAVQDLDTDGDGVTDWEELRAGYNPNTAASFSGTNDLTAITAALQSTNVITITPGNPYAAMTGPVPGTVLVQRSGGLGAVTVNFTLSGTATAGVDYATIPLSVTLPVGVNTGTVTFNPIPNPAAIVTKVASLNSSYGTAHVTIDPLDTPSGTGLLGQYYDNSNLTYTNSANFSGFKFSRVDPTVDFFWGQGQPYTTVNIDQFSASWDAKLIPPTTGNYLFSLAADDGARLYITNALIVDAWAAGSSTTNPVVSAPVALVAGSNYAIRVEYWENTNAASISLQWQNPGSSTFGSLSSTYIQHPTLATNRWSANYYNNTNLLTSVTNTLESSVSFNWGVGMPDPSMGIDSFSIRWTGQVQPERTEPYSFFIYHDDGVKLWVDNQLIIDRWINSARFDTGTVAMVAGKRYDIKLEYYENSGNATNSLFWWSPSQTKQIIPMARLYPNTNAASNVTSPLQAVALVGGPFNYQLTGNNLPLASGATGLPPGLTFNAGTGLITGTPTTAGNYKILLNVSGGRGTSYAILDLTVLNTGGTIYRESWNGAAAIPTNSPPSGSNTLTSLQGPPNAGDNYAARIRGWLTPQITGNYRFWISSDGPSEFWLSTDADAVNKVRRCTVTNSTAALDWNAEPNQKSYLIRLKAGQPYYLEILHTETTGNDHVAVGWAKPGESAPSEVVPGYALSPYAPPTGQDGSNTLFVAVMTPQGAAASQGSGVATLRLAADESSADLSFYYSNLTGPITSEHVHDAATGGLIMFDIDDAVPTNGVYHWVFVPTGTLTIQDQINSLKSGNAYINIHTALYPSGEIKGFFQRTAGSSTFTPPAAPPALPGGTPTTNDAVRFLMQATYGATDATITQVQAMGFNAWIDDQFNLPMSSHLANVIAYYAANPLASTNGYPTFNTWWKYALTAPDQLRQRVAFALSEIFVVSENNADLDNQPWGLSSYYDVLVTNAFGNFRQLLNDVTLHPSMGAYLDMVRNDKPDAATGRSPNENYAREVLQLFSIGVQKKHPDGTLKLSSDGLPIPTYGQEEVVGYAHTFTGWAYYSLNQSFTASANFTNQMILIANRHDTDNDKLLLDNVVLPAGQTGTQDLQDALDIIFQNANTGPFICRQLIQRLVTANPSPAYLYRVTSAFNDNGQGVRGDLKAVVKAILLDYEARSTSNLFFQGTGHLREPLLRTTSIMRAFKASSITTNYTMNNTDSDYAQTPLRPPTVFNFFEPDYSYPGEIAQAGLYAPEFQITSETTTIQYMNAIRSGLYNTTGFKSDIVIDLATEQALASNPTALIDRLNTLLMAGTMSSAFRTYLINYIGTLPTGSSANYLERARTAIHLITTSAEFCIQR